MKGLLVLAFMVMLSVLAGCSAIYGVNYEYDNGFNFRQLEAYDWDPVKIEAEQDNLTIKRIQNAVNKNLQSKGYIQSSTSPDFIIATHVGTQQRLAGAPDPYMAAYGPYTAPPPQYYEERNFVLDFVDPDNKYLIWRGSARADVTGISTPEAMEKTINAAVEKILKRFPPQ